MKSLVYRSLTICAILACAFSSVAQGNHYFSNNILNDPFGKFQIYFPVEPKYSYQDLDTEIGQVRMYQFMYETDKIVYMMSYVDYPSDKIAGQDNDALLKRAAIGFIDALKLTTRSETVINYASHKGLLFYADNGEIYTAMRDFMVNNRLYQIGILQYGQIPMQTENDFFDSFVLTK